MILVPQVSVNFGISPSSKFYTNLVISSLKIRGFSSSYQILLSLFDILNAFYDNI